MSIHIDNCQNEERSNTANATHISSNDFCKPSDETGFVQSSCKTHQAAHPNEGVPSTFFFNNVVPFDSVTAQHQANAHQRNHGSVKASEGRGCPHTKSKEEYAKNSFFVAAHGTHCFQFFASNFRSFRSFFQFRREQFVNQVRANNQSQYTGNDTSKCPTAPRNINACCLSCQSYAQGVRCNRCNKHRGSDAVCLESRFHQVSANAFSGFFVRFGFKSRAQAANYREQDTATTSSIGRSCRRDNQVGNCHGVAKLQGAATNCRHNFIRNSFAKTRFNKAKCK